MLRQVDDFLLTCDSETTAKNIFDTIRKKIQFDSEKEKNIIPFEYLGVVTDYNGVDIIQTPDYIEMSCGNYIRRLLKSHGWDTASSKPLPLDALPVNVSPKEGSSINNNSRSDTLDVNKNEVSALRDTGTKATVLHNTVVNSSGTGLQDSTVSSLNALLPCNTVANSPGTNLCNAMSINSSPPGTETYVEPLRCSNPTSLKSSFESNC